MCRRVRETAVSQRPVKACAWKDYSHATATHLRLVVIRMNLVENKLLRTGENSPQYHYVTLRNVQQR